MPSTHKLSKSEPDLSYGEIVIRCEEVLVPGQRAVLVPKVEILNAGKLTPGWFNQHLNLFLRRINEAQITQRTGRVPNSVGAE